MINDPLGGLSISPQGIMARDAMVFDHCLSRNKVPVVMLMSGGYQMNNAEVIADSIGHIISKYNLK